MTTTIKKAALGAGAGAVATAAMSGLMMGAKAAGLMGKMPPERITEAALNAAQVPRTEHQEDAASTAAHLAYGMGSGALYALLPTPRRGGAAALAGGAYAAVVWAVSYFGWVPALRILPPPHRDRPDRQISMVAAHLVYGAVLGATLSRLRR